jgi:hypothetical protein
MDRIKIFTNEGKVHGQISALETLLGRPISCEISLNKKDIADNIQFDATVEEVEKLHGHGINLLRRQGGHWLPFI